MRGVLEVHSQNSPVSEKRLCEAYKNRENIFVVSIRRHVPIKEMMKKAADYGVFAAEKSK